MVDGVTPENSAGIQKASLFEKTRNVLLAGAVVVGLSFWLQGSDKDPLYGKSLGPIERADDMEWGKDEGKITARDYDVIKNPKFARTVADTNFLGGGITIDGFDVSLHSKRFFSNANPESEFYTVSLIDTRLPEDNHTLTGNNIISPKFKYDEFKYVDPTTTDLGLTSGSMGNKSWAEGGPSIDGGLASTTTQRIVINRQQVQDGKKQNVSSKYIPVEFIDNTRCAGVENGITSEIALPKRYHQRVCRYLGLLDELVPDDYRFFLNYVEDDFDKNDMVIGGDSNRSLILSLPFQKVKHGYDESFSTSLHESLHTTYAEQDDASEIKQNVDNAYEAVRASMTYRMPDYIESYLGYDIRANEPGWAALTESTYVSTVLGDKESNAGHPWSNPTEMLSSTISVLSVYPIEFIKNYKELDEDKQEAVKEAVSSAIEFLEATTSKKTFAAILSEYKLIKRSLDI